MAVAGPAARRPRASALRSGAGRRLVGAGLIGVLVAGLLVGPVLCWAGAARTGTDQPAPAAALLSPVPYASRERPVGPPARTVDAAAVLAGVDAAAGPVGGSVGAVVLDAQGRTLVQTPAAGVPIPSASLVKLLVVHQLLARAAPGGWEPQTLRRMERAITVSDDEAMNALWVTFDGPALVRDAVVAFGLTGTAPPAVPGQWGQAPTTASDVARFLGALAARPGSPGSAVLLDWMRAAAPVAADGFDQAFGLLSEGAGAAVAAKQGWMCCVADRRHLHSAGVLADGRVVVVLAELPEATTWPAAAAAVDGVAAALLAGTR